jgi:hypothetical protein
MDLSQTQRVQKVRWLAAALGPEILRVDDEARGWPALVRVKVGHTWVSVALHVSLVIESGEGRSDPDECRIEPPPGKSVLAPQGYIPVVVGVLAGEPPPQVVVLWDVSTRVGRKKRSSIYSRWSAIRLAADKGWYEHVNGVSETVVAADVAMLPRYISRLRGIGVPSPVAKIRPMDLGVPFQPRLRRPRVARSDPFSVDPERVERGNVAHETTLEHLAAFLASHGHAPLAPGEDDPQYDLAWVTSETTFVAEVKSVTDANEDKQLRLGLGQVLWYRHLLAANGRRAAAVLVAEREPRDPRWRGVCRDCGVTLVWPQSFDELLAALHVS